MARKRVPGTKLAAAAALLVIAGAAVTGCGQASIGGAVPAGSTRSAPGTSRQPGASDQPGATGRPTPATASGSPGAPPAKTRLCSVPGAVRRVEVFRIPGLGEPGPVQPVPRKLPAVTIAQRDRVVALARAICELPRVPYGMMSCPIDIGGGFALVFAAANLRLPPVAIRASGCETVVGASAGLPRWIPAAPGFWVTFTRLTGISAPSHRP